MIAELAFVVSWFLLGLGTGLLMVAFLLSFRVRQEPTRKPDWLVIVRQAEARRAYDNVWDGHGPEQHN